jgi:hypothetical protein
MKKTIAFILLTLPLVASADYLDVIEIKLNEGCSFQQQQQITKDFNEQWAAKYGYRAELLMPVQSPNLTSIFWVGRTKDAASFGKAWDAWRNDQSDPNSMPAKLWARFQACGTNLSRRGYDAY